MIWDYGKTSDLGFYTCMSSSLLENRRELVRYAQDERFSHILWLDDDMVFPTHTLKALVAHDVPIVGCNCTTRGLPLRTTSTIKGDRVSSVGKTGLEEVETTGLAVMMTQTEIFKRLPEPWFATQFNGAETERKYVGEDVWFCRLAKHFGYKIMIDHDLSRDIGHLGEVQFGHEMLP